MNIDGKPVPLEIVAGWRLAFGRVSDANLRALATANANLHAGFRPGTVALAVVVQRAQAALTTLAYLPADYKTALQGATLSRSLMSVFSEEVILLSAEGLAQCFGRAETMGAMLLDDRPAIRAKGFDLIEAWDGAEPSAEESKQAADDLAAELAPFWTHAQAVTGRAGVPPLAAPDGAALHVRVRQPRAQNERHLVLTLREKRVEANRLRRELDTVKPERDRLSTQNVSLSTNLLNITNQLSTLQANLDDRVAAAVQAQLHERLHPWLRPAEELERIASDVLNRGVLEQAADVLVKQANIDRRFGIRSQLQIELDRCEGMLQKIRAAQFESINPLPDLVPMAEQITARIAELHLVLRWPQTAAAAANPAFVKLTQSIAGALTIDAVAAIRSALQASERLKLLGDEELQSAYGLLREATSRVYARGIVGRANSHAALAQLPLHAMQIQLAQGAECTLVVDGHNVLFKLPTLFGGEFERGVPGAHARRSLVSKLVALGHRYPNLTIRLWFDAAEIAEDTVSENVRVNYSGGVGDNRADHQIVAYLRHLAEASPEQTRAVVTADGQEAADASSTGAMVMAPQELALWMN